MSALLPESRQVKAARRGRFAFGLSQRAMVLLFGGIGWVLLAFFWRGFLAVLVAWDLVVILLAILDWLRLPEPESIIVSRSWLTVPALGQDAEVELGVFHEGSQPLTVRVIDDLPPRMLPIPPELRGMAWPREELELRYRFMPAERGDHECGRVYLRYASAVGLTERWAYADLKQTVRVFPRMLCADEDSLFLARSRQIEMQRRKDQLRGQGREFESLRDYREGGDDLREVCWTASARRGTLICRQYQMERSQPVWLVLDAGRLLNARSGEYTRLDHNAAAALAVAQTALLVGDRVGLLGYGRTVQQRVMLGRGKSHYRQILDASAHLRTEPGEASHLAAAALLARLQPTRSLILWFTDLTESAMRPEVIDGAFQLMRRHLVLFVVPVQEEMAAFVAERPRNTTQMFERAAAQELMHRREVLLAELRSRGALTIEAPAAGLATAALNRYLEVKEAALI